LRQAHPRAADPPTAAPHRSSARTVSRSLNRNGKAQAALPCRTQAVNGRIDASVRTSRAVRSPARRADVQRLPCCCRSRATF